jgi:phosphatidate phosphatase APP1
MQTPSRQTLLFALFVVVTLNASAASATPGPSWVDAYGGWAGPNGGHLYARVHKGKKPAADFKNEKGAEKLVHTLEQLEVDAWPGAAVTIAVEQGPSASVMSDAHGFIDFKLPAGLRGPHAKVTLSVAASKVRAAASASVEVPVWPDQPGALGVISDIDDTLTDSDVPHKLHLAWNTLFRSAYDVKVFEGAGAGLTAVAGKDSGATPRPLFFDTGSPWNLHERIAFAFGRAGVPPGAFVLRQGEAGERGGDLHS